MFLPKSLAFLVVIAACSRAASTGASAPAAAPAPAQSTSVATGRAPYTQADVHFMSGMIVHHRQAVVMSRWATDTAHGASGSVRGLSERIIVAQSDEMAFLERWLRERNEPLMDHAMQMPGMLTPEQLSQLDRARGTEFDRQFLTLMIQHHQGALTMVDELLKAQGAAQDGVVFRFLADVHADQSTEIQRMQRMLDALPSGGK